MRFPADFQWGAATAATQIEGAARADGKGESIWDRFAALGGVPGGLAAVDRGSGHYERWADDIAIMSEMGLGVYRFSVSWPRILPEGSGSVNQKGLDFYRRLIDGLHAKGIKPALTLYHWDLPQALQEKGGWLNRETAYRFADYASVLFREFGDQVDLWMTLNEPFVVTFFGYMTGEHAPGVKRPFSAMQAAHHLLLGHGEAVKAFRSMAPAGSKIGLTNFLWMQEPASDRPADVAAARRADGMLNRWFLDPVLKGEYPPEIMRHFRWRGAAPKVRSGDLETISQPIDFMGVQYYSRILHRANPLNLFTGFSQVTPTGVPLTEMGNEIYPEGLYKLLMRLTADYPNLPLIITENGAAFPDTVTPEGQVHDEQRLSYLQEHIRAVGRALADGANVKGYYVWTLLDNLEWSLGTAKRFGLIHVDFDSMKRTWKDSAHWYRDFLAGGANLPD